MSFHNSCQLSKVNKVSLALALRYAEHGKYTDHTEDFYVHGSKTLLCATPPTTGLVPFMNTMVRT